MASSTPCPASDSRSKKPLGKMAGWLRQVLSKKPKEMPVSQETTSSDAPPRSSHDPPSSGLSSSALAESPSALPPAPESASGRSSGGDAASSSSSSGRWSRDYDVCVCHSEEDLAAAQDLVAYLEDSPVSLRCFLQLRDSAPGGAIVSELCRALDSSHCRVLLITPGFLRDPWCRSAEPHLNTSDVTEGPRRLAEAGNQVRELEAWTPQCDRAQGARGGSAL